MPKIENLTSIQVLDSRGLPTISTEIQLDDGTRSVAMSLVALQQGKKKLLSFEMGVKHFMVKA